MRGALAGSVLLVTACEPVLSPAPQLPPSRCICILQLLLTPLRIILLLLVAFWALMASWCCCSRPVLHVLVPALLLWLIPIFLHGCFCYSRIFLLLLIPTACYCCILIPCWCSTPCGPGVAFSSSSSCSSIRDAAWLRGLLLCLSAAAQQLRALLHVGAQQVHHC